MDVSILAAKLMGPVFVVVGLGMLLRREHYKVAIKGFVDSPSLILFSTMLAMAMGLLLVNTHKIWRFNWQVIVTLIGWFALAKGVTGIIFPDVMRKLATAYANSRWFMPVDALFAVGFGVWLSLRGYGLGI
jgi:hypothetical protein